MIIEYQRPKTVQEALTFLAREKPLSYPLGGGTYLNRGEGGEFAVIDLQDLGLDRMSKRGKILEIGATTTLQSLIRYEGLTEGLYSAIRHETTYNLRQMATVAGTLVTADGRSSLTTMLLALDASLEILELNKAPKLMKLGDWLPLREGRSLTQLISKISLPVNVKSAYESISRSPADLPIICAAVTEWPSGRTRLALGGWGKAPVMAMDGPEADGIEISAKDAYSHAEDEWASAEYRQEMASLLALRCVKRLNP